MSIPQGLIIYKALRHQESHPMNIKHRYYPDKIMLSAETPKATRSRTTNQKNRPQVPKMTKITKLVRCLSLSLEPVGLKKSQVTRDFSKFHRIKKCIVQFSSQTRALSKNLEVPAVKIIQRTFKTLKHLEHVEMNELDSLQKNSGTFGNLILQRSLQKLIINPFAFSEDIKCLKPFTELAQKVSQRKAWPRLNYLKIGLLCTEEGSRNANAHRNSKGSLGNLLKFIQDLKSCKSLYKYLHLGLILPENTSSGLSTKNAAAFKEILKISPPLTHVSAFQSEHIISLFEKAQNSKDLKSLALQLSNGLQDYLKMDPLEKFPALQEMSLVVNCSEELDNESPEAHFSYFALERIQELTNLTRVSLHFDGEPGTVDDLLHAAISKLTKLTHLKLSFSNMIPSEYQFEEYDEEEGPFKLNWSWLKSIFQAIGKRKKLKELSLDFETWSLEDSSQHFKSLCQALGNLKQLSSLHLSIRDEEFLTDQDVCTLASHLNKLTMLESLFLNLGYAEFKSKTFVVLMDSIRSLPILSDLGLEILSFEVTKQCSQMVYEVIHQMKCLNRVKLVIGNKVAKGVNLTLLETEARKRMAGDISCYKY